MWDLVRGERIGEPLTGHLESVTVVAGTPAAVTQRWDGTGAFGHRIHLWDLT
ncbi:hypothetical protein [Spirillospora sp. CA-128828]|uniref:hypothetical protein n=1 Tax=Spirillospora sp. CA-128828 TaxID=3240033 RepID=UPI003D8D1897